MKKKDGYKKAFIEIETASFMEELAENLKEETLKNGAAAEFSLDRTLPGRLRLDGSFLKEAFLTLFSHCAKSSRNGRCVFCVRGESLEESSYRVRISVSEAGEGFAAEELEALDGRKAACSTPYLSKLFAIRKGAEQRRGKFFVYSTTGGGTVYYMVLPCEILTPVTIGEVEEERAQKRKETGLHNLEKEQGEGQSPEKEWIDRKLALNYAGNMEEMRLELLNIYYDQAQKYLKELPLLFEAKDWKKYRITVHAIKGNSLGIGAESFSKEAYEQEIAAKDGDIEKIEASFQEFYEHYRSLVEEVKNSKL